MKKFLHIITFFLSVSLAAGPMPLGSAAPLSGAMPVAHELLITTKPYAPPMLQGMLFDDQDPLNLRFILSHGDAPLEGAEWRAVVDDQLSYFFAGLTIPEKDLWVNLSPGEADRILPTDLGKTELGEVMLAQDLYLKQLTASLLHPENPVGQAFWAKAHQCAQGQLGTSEIPVDTFNKVWITPDEVAVYVDEGRVYITTSQLKVQLADDYWRTKGEASEVSDSDMEDKTRELSHQVMRDVVLPALTREVNEGRHFAPLRQVFHAMILARWYKDRLLAGQQAAWLIDQKKTQGVQSNWEGFSQDIFGAYQHIYQNGLYEVIHEVYDPLTHSVVPRKYFSGGNVWKFGNIPSHRDLAALSSAIARAGSSTVAEVNVEPKVDPAFFKNPELEKLLEKLPFNGSGEATKDMVMMSPPQRAANFFDALTHDQPVIDGKRVYFLEGVDTMEDFNQTIKQAVEFLNAHALDDNKAFQVLNQMYEKDIALGVGWGRTGREMKDNLTRFKELVTAKTPRSVGDNEYRKLEATMNEVMDNLIIRWAYVLDSIHGYVNQNKVLGIDDTGGQIEYILHYVHQLSKLLQKKAEQGGFFEEGESLMPQIIVLTRLMSDKDLVGADAAAKWGSINSYLDEEVFNDIKGEPLPNTTIVRVPFRNTQGEEEHRFIKRQEIWPWLIRYALDAQEKLDDFLSQRGLSGVKPLHMGQYSDGSVVAMLSAYLNNDIYTVVPHASERAKWRKLDKGGNVIAYPADDKTYLNASIQYLLDEATYKGGYLVTSSQQSELRQIFDAFNGLVDAKELKQAFERFGRYKIMSNHLGISPKLLDLSRTPEELSKEYQIFMRLYREIKQRIYAKIDPSRRQAFILMLKRFIKGSKERYGDVEGFQALEVEADQFSVNEVRPLTVFTNVGRMAPEKNVLAIIKPLVGEDGTRQILIEWLNKNFNDMYNNEKKVLLEGNLPTIFLTDDFLNEVLNNKNPELRQGLENIKKMRERSLFILIGGAEKDEEYQKIKQLVKVNDLGSNVILMESLDNEIIYPILKNLQQNFLQPAFNEPYGITILEAMSMGGLLVTMHAGATDLIRDEDDLKRFIFDPNDPASVREAMLMMIDMSEEDWQHVAARFYEVVTQLAGWPNKAKHTLEYMERIILMNATDEARQEVGEANKALIRELINIYESQVKVKFSQSYSSADFKELNERVGRGSSTVVGGIDIGKMTIQEKGSSVLPGVVNFEGMALAIEYVRGVVIDVQVLRPVGRQDIGRLFDRK